MHYQNKNIRKIWLCHIALLITLITISCKMGGGFFPHAEKYVLDVEEEHLISKIQKFKIENPEYILPSSSQLEDGRKSIGGQEHWYIFYFYLSEENKILLTWIRGTFERNRTTFALVSVNEGLELGNWKRINKDLDSAQNKELKNIFEDRILSGVKDELENNN